MIEQDDVRFGDRNTLCGLICAVHEFADIAYQQRVWIEGNGLPQIGSYSESMCRLFDDARIEEFANGKARDFGFSEVALTSLSALAHVLDNFDKELPRGLSDAEIVRREGWAEVVAAAGCVLDSGVLDRVAANCESYPMFPLHWGGRVVGGTWKQ